MVNPAADLSRSRRFMLSILSFLELLFPDSVLFQMKVDTMKMLFCIILAVALFASPQYARSREVGSWESLAALESGRRIRVETANSKQSGSLVRLSADSITLHLDRAGEVTLPRLEVTRVFAQSESHRVRNTVIGFVIGATIGAVLYGTIGQLFRSEGAESAGFLGVPMGVGTAIGAALPARGMVLLYRTQKSSGAKVP
jgi:hypothetical protein